MPEEFLLSLQAAYKSLQTADHMVYITFPLIKDNRLLIKILNEVYMSILGSINAILQYESAYKRIALTDKAKENFDIFREKCAPRFGITPDELEKAMEIFKMMEEHKASPMEFVKNNKFVILSDNLKTDTLTLAKLKEYLITGKSMLQKTSEKIKASG